MASDVRHVTTKSLDLPKDDHFYDESSMDWKGIEAQFVDLKNALTAPRQEISSDEERSRAQKNAELGLRALIELIEAETSNLLDVGKLEEGVFGSIRCLSYSEEVFGNQSAELVSPYLLIARAMLSSRNFRKAEQFLALANWGLHKNPELPDDRKAECRYLSGILAVETQKPIKEAICHFAAFVYHTAVDYGALSIHCATGFMHLGSIFMSNGDVDAAMGCFDTIEKAYASAMGVTQHATETSGVPAADELREYLSRSFTRELSLQCLNLLLSVYSTRFGEKDIRTAGAHQLLGMLFRLLDEGEKARVHLMRAADIMRVEIGSSAPAVAAIERVVASLSAPKE